MRWRRVVLGVSLGAAAALAAWMSFVVRRPSVPSVAATPPTPDRLPRGSVLLEIDLGVAPEVAWSAIAERNDRAVALVGARARGVQRAWLAVDVTDTPGGPRVVELEPSPGTDDPVAAPRPSFMGDRIALVVHAQRAGDRVVASVSRVDARVALAFGSARVELPAGASLPPSGAPAAELHDGALVVPLVRAERPALLHMSAAHGVRELPEGRLVAMLAGAPPHVLLWSVAHTGFVEIARYPVPADGAPWTAVDRAQIPYTAALTMDASTDQVCGLTGEAVRPLTGTSPEGGVVLAVTSDQLYPLRFKRAAHEDVSVVCGACPPILVAKRATDLRLLVTVGRKLASSPVSVPPGVDEGAMAAGACSDVSTVIAYIAGREVLTQRTRPEGGWSLEAPVRVAAPDERGDPVEPRALAVGSRLIVLWRRKTESSVRLEYVTSTDGGATFR